MKLAITNARVWVTPKCLLEGVHIGDVEARDAYWDLLMDATIYVDSEEIDRVSVDPDVLQGLLDYEPADPKYKGKDWRAKDPAMRKMQKSQRPVITHIAKEYQHAVVEAILGKFHGLPKDWVDALIGPGGKNLEYGLEQFALQLSPAKDPEWRQVFVQVKILLGDENEGFMGKLAKDFQRALAAGTVKQQNGQAVWDARLTGLNSALADLDPYSGAKMSNTKIGNLDIADEPGYDKHIREGMAERMEEVLSLAGDGEITHLKINDDGSLSFNLKETKPEVDPGLGAVGELEQDPGDSAPRSEPTL